MMIFYRAGCLVAANYQLLELCNGDPATMALHAGWTTTCVSMLFFDAVLYHFPCWFVLFHTVVNAKIDGFDRVGNLIQTFVA